MSTVFTTFVNFSGQFFCQSIFPKRNNFNKQYQAVRNDESEEESGAKNFYPRSKQDLGCRRTQKSIC